ncbi:phytoene/squalene synthase family protein [Lysinibacillus sp. 2017]|uniref:squalene/phytoene synthase family protein n=1 Tax=unclassified Lysinibacillus TaxID=2636778 RepID=UPI000D527E98|nr:MULTISPECIES: squalene/phytoene synthase family protein [unclassified Lysinibacillus]AWE07064.1 phytoene/squalene synthase family protein [Lysinibacillus sp. 2017]TGN37016.1 phytoene/squalene synthase family protein [Lysinibacillus sp. S2017]
MTNKPLQKDTMRVLKETSRTFYIPITFLDKELKMTVAAAYLAMRAIDEIEDHEDVENEVKHDVLLKVEQLLLAPEFDHAAYMEALAPVLDEMPEVTLRLADWIEVCPAGARGIVMRATSEMAGGMGKWALANWQVHTREDLDDYTYYVAGLVGVMLSELWEWSAGIKTDRDLAIGYGRGLQAVNILRNEQEDMDERGVSFVPDGWTRTELFAYAEENLAKADLYMKDINKRSIKLFCRLPLALAHKTLQALKEGRVKMSRAEVEATVEEVQED